MNKVFSSGRLANDAFDPDPASPVSAANIREWIVDPKGMGPQEVTGLLINRGVAMSAPP
jgi:hypothetical protein